MANPYSQTQINPQLQKIICCPKDKSNLIINDDQKVLFCEICKENYFIKESVPILLSKEIIEQNNNSIPSNNENHAFSNTKKAHEKIPTGYQVKQLKSKSKIKRFWNFHKFTKIQKYLPKEGKILDIGCGSGAFESLKNTLNLQNTKIIGLDITPKQVIFAQQNHKESLFVAGSGHELPFKDNSFDAVVLIEFIEHIPKNAIQKLLKEAKRVLKDNGKIIITTPNYQSPYLLIEWLHSKFGKVNYSEQHITHFTPKRMRKALKIAGFNKLKITTTYGIAPFLAPISKKLALKALKNEPITEFGCRLKLISIASK